jgi:hypothetical protein
MWLLEKLSELLMRARGEAVPGAVFWTIAVLVGVGLLALLVRMAWTMRGLRGVRGGSTPFAVASAADAWEMARNFAARGDYTSAAHALYAGLLHTIARSGEVELDEAKTIGDYTRELARSSSRRLPRFREFARSYEIVIYGLGFCDKDRFERLEQLASNIAGAHG